MSLENALRLAREHGDFRELCDAIPYARFLDLSLGVVDESVRGTMRFIPTNVGNPVVGALHGGTIGALLEFTAVAEALRASTTMVVPKTINLTVEYLRSAALVDTFAGARIERIGKRIAVVRVVAWQADPDTPVAAATAQFLLTPNEPDT